jgi:hypothetical protein
MAHSDGRWEVLAEGLQLDRSKFTITGIVEGMIAEGAAEEILWCVCAMDTLS